MRVSFLSVKSTMDRPPAPPPPSDPRDARPLRRHDSEAETTSEPESSRGGMEAPADPQLLLNGASKEAGRPSPAPPAAPVPVPVIELVRRGGSLDIKTREAAGEAMQRAPGAEPCRAAEAACETRMVQLSPPALPLQPPGRAMLYNLGQPLATINSGFFGEPDSFSMYGSNRVKRRPSPYEMEITDDPGSRLKCDSLVSDWRSQMPGSLLDWQNDFEGRRQGAQSRILLPGVGCGRLWGCPGRGVSAAWKADPFICGVNSTYK
ncbi:T-cell acute lymphocytic leukemia protein 1 isoform X4 [Pogoniulus pusillus]|uniref:T-cell acute lymphocytic leukemia protein 1 isoform X4 n=1 Tax=Pogoniulus pusillus TaxID=488313 RepID=UPI0030B96CFC